VAGAVITGAVVGLAARNTTIGTQRRNAADGGRYADEPLGALPPDRASSVAAEDGLPISVEEVDPIDGGEPALTVVLVHGYILDRRCWHFQRRDLAALTEPPVRLVLYDQRSHGRSGRGSPESLTIEQLGRDLDSVLRVIAPEGPLVLVGHSMGGMTIMALAEQQPTLFTERVRGVALIASSAGEVGQSGLSRSVLSKRNPVTFGFGQLAAWQPGLVEWARRAGGHLTWGAIRALAFGDRKVDPALVDLMEKMIAKTPVQGINGFLSTLGLHRRFAALAGLRQCDVLVLSGDVDRITPISHSESIAAELPDAEFVRVPGAGHMVMLEQPEFVTDHLVELIRRCAEVRTGWRRWWKRA
jgi:pimeloyl-ACP methyl ester carboxylesterase